MIISDESKKIIGIYMMIETSWISLKDKSESIFYMLSEAPKEAPESVRAYVLEYLAIALRAPYSALKKRDKIAFASLKNLYASVRTSLDAQTSGMLFINFVEFVKNGKIKLGKNRYNNAYYSLYRTAAQDFQENIGKADLISAKRKLARASRSHFTNAYKRLGSDQRFIDFNLADKSKDYLQNAEANFKRFWSLYEVPEKRTRKYSCERLFVADRAINEHMDEFLFGLSNDVEDYRRDQMFAPTAFDYLLDIRKCHKWISGRVTNADRSTLDMLAKPWVPGCN